MPTSINGTTGVSQVQDNTITSAKIVDGSVAQVDLTLDGSSIGVGQTWQSFTVGTTRVFGTTYTNSTGKPIQVKVYKTFSSPTTNTDLSLTVSGIQVDYQSAFSTTGGNWGIQVSAIVPYGATYSAASSGVASTSNIWSELR